MDSRLSTLNTNRSRSSWVAVVGFAPSGKRAVSCECCVLTLAFVVAIGVLDADPRQLCMASPQSDSAATNQQSEVVPNASIIVGLPTSYAVSPDRMIVEPRIELGATFPSSSDEINLRWMQTARPSAVLQEVLPLNLVQEALPPPLPLELPIPRPPPSVMEVPSALEAAPVFQNLVGAVPQRGRHRPMRDPCTEKGLGYERLAFSIFDIEPAQPSNNFRVRSVFGSRLQLPDRAEYFWNRTVGQAGPARGESIIDYRDLRLRLELGSKKFATIFEVPFREVDPRVNNNHAGLGDLQLITKTVFIESDKWLMTQYFGTHFATGASRMGLGTGHVALEPGFLFRNKWNDLSWLHGELKFWFPLGAHPNHHGQVLKFASGVNRIWRDSDTSAVLPSLELTTYSILNGLARNEAGVVREIDSDIMLYLTPGIRYVVDPKLRSGFFEIGSSMSIALTDTRFTDTTLVIDARWSW